MNNPALLVEYPEGGLVAKHVREDGSDTHDLSEASDEESDSEDDSSCYSDSSSEQSLGSIITKMGIEMPDSSPNTMKRVHSMPTLMRLETAPDQSQMKAEQRRSFNNFMDRMNKCSTGYFQAAPPPPSQARVPVTRTKARSTGALDEIHKSTSSTDGKNPANFFQAEVLVEELTVDLSESFWESYFLPITQDRIQGYTHQAVGAIRALDVATLRTIAHQSGNATMNACSPQGDSLLHVACRRGDEAVFLFLVQEARASVKVRDDWNKTILHDLCWGYKVGNVAQFQWVKLVLDHAPELLFAKDKRGFCALQYVPKDAWADWCRFLMQEQDFIRAKIDTMGALALGHDESMRDAN